MDEELNSWTLHIAGTRPAMFYGIPWELFVPLFIATGVLGVINWWMMIFSVPVWVSAAWLVRRDYNAPRVWILWVQDAALDLNTSIWGGASVSPFPLRPSKRFRGIPDVR